MNILCAVKFVPDVDRVAIDVENIAGGFGNNRAGRSSRMILNPDDACALAFALGVKAEHPEYTVEVVTLGPSSLSPHMEDLLRLAVDRATLISDADLDTGALTSRVLASYISTRPFHCILTGSHSLDGGSARVPVELAEILGLDQMLGVTGIDPDRFDTMQAVIDVAEERGRTTYDMAMPCVLSLTRESGYRLPYAKLTDMRRDVSDELIVVSADDSGVQPLTTVVNRYPKIFEEKDRQVVGTDDAGIEQVFDFLKAKGFLSI